MKKLIGVFVFLLVLAFTILLVLSIWGVNPFSWLAISKTALTILIVCIGILVLYVIGYLFFKNGKKGYDTTKDDEAHPIK